MDVMSANFGSGNLVRNSWMSSVAHIPKNMFGICATWAESAPAENDNLVTLFYECMENPYAHFSGVFFEKMPDLSCDVVGFKGAG